jgi:hypothetical protein
VEKFNIEMTFRELQLVAWGMGFIQNYLEDEWERYMYFFVERKILENYEMMKGIEKKLEDVHSLRNKIYESIKGRL